MVKVVGYHPEILVRKPSGELVRLYLTMDDWYSDEEVRAALALGCPSCRTLGDVVTLLEGDGELQKTKSGLVSVCIEKLTGVTAQTAAGWDEVVD